MEKLFDFAQANGPEIPFIAVSEKLQEATKDKTGGLNITLWTGVNYVSKYDMDKKVPVDEPITIEEGLYLTQKYSKISGRHLVENLERMGHDDTEVLQDHFFNYVLRPMRTGFPRLIPVSMSDKKPETPPEK